MDAVKDPVNLADAFGRLAQMIPEARSRLRLIMVGDGAEKPAVQACLARHGLSGQAWLPGSRDDVPTLLRALDIFVLPSLSEGISNTILEAMACGIPVVATAVGGNPELVAEGETGALVPRADSAALARALLDYVRQPAVRRRRGAGHCRSSRRSSVCR
jgi:glycosyltransferase involved in cell wall biosynthesis